MPHATSTRHAWTEVAPPSSQDGSYALQREGYFPVGSAIQAQRANLAEAVAGGRQGAHLQAGQEGSDPFPNWRHPQGLPRSGSGDPF
ncbi:hypothetical protein IscW_ISCW011780 [Ixodes scapularis]|uniref:Uncharacterized protein n=1 Tax=Ixodes scapularis TaxID=6945 RepID=B7Q635_IXOSC|nr:hypothetical protein IscW_ISCW011780 [Ixodes scapularis]|eukprot:XP_002411882.1 hypothetical protein IscW_ISCW011780 [Ixodes scapularis]